MNASAAFVALDESNFHARLREQLGPVLVIFSHAGCGTCRQVERLLPGATTLPLFRVDAAASSGLTRALEVFHLPALFLYRDGHYHARLDCAVTPTSLTAHIAAALAAPAQEEP